MLKIALDTSPTNDQNSSRGVGFYTQRLYDAMQNVVKNNPNYKEFFITQVNSTQHQTDISLMHYPYFDLFKTSLNVKIKPTIVTIHDLIPIQFKSQFPVGIRGNIAWQIQKYNLKHVDFIITDSIFSKFSIAKYTNFPDDRIFHIYLAADSSYFPISKSHAKKLISDLKLPEKFVLYIGDVNWNKNLISLAKSCISLNYPLVIVGKTASMQPTQSHPWLKSLFELKQLQKYHPEIILTIGYQPNEIVNALYNCAMFYCQPSYSEGFGLPLLEAMQAGCPIVYSEASSLPEITEYIGLFFDPNNLSEMQLRLKQMWQNKKHQLESKRMGIERAKIFSWKNTAIQTMEVYRLALAKYGKI